MRTGAASGGGTVKLTTELIYEAALDDEIFAELPSIIAEAVDARSCVLHWRTGSGAAEIFAHSGYFSDEQMANYASNFASHDLWTDAGMRQGFVNKAWNTADLVPTSDYERSIFYNEWIRGMGDDTFYCCGSVMQTLHGQGIIGLHRGKTQADFAPQVLRQLNERVEHLRRMFAIRGRLSHLAERHDLLNAIFAAGHEAALVLGAGGRLLMANPAGEAFLQGAKILSIRNGFVQARGDEGGLFEAAAAHASNPHERRASECLMRSADGKTAVLSLMPLPALAPRHAVLVTVTEPRSRPARDVVARHVMSMHGLSAAEADVALRLAEGQDIGRISDERGSTTDSVRTQVKQILSKMGARRQADVVRFILSLW